MKAVLISIQPKWCEKIAIGKKTIEVRKTKPSILTPFKVYIYCTKTKNKWSLCDYEGAYRNSEGEIVYAQQHVIGEFICDKIEVMRMRDCSKACLTIDELIAYKTNKLPYAWHISDLKIYDKPKEISEFFTIKYDKVDYCVGCPHHETPVTEYPCCDCVCEAGNRKYLTRPPQSWMYIEKLEE